MANKVLEWKPPARNFAGVQHEPLRRQIDDRFNAVHDELSAAYYYKELDEAGNVVVRGRPFRGKLLTKEEFDELHAMIFHIRSVTFHRENLRRPPVERIPEAVYDLATDAEGRPARASERAAAEIARLKAKGHRLDDLEA